MPTFWRVFIINGCWILSKAFSASTEMILWFLFFNFLMWWITLINLHKLKNTCITGINPHLIVVCVILLLYCWIWFANVLLKSFVSIFVSDIVIIFFFCGIFVRFGYQVDGGLTEWVCGCSFLWTFWKCLGQVLTLEG